MSSQITRAVGPWHFHTCKGVSVTWLHRGHALNVSSLHLTIFLLTGHHPVECFVRHRHLSESKSLIASPRASQSTSAVVPLPIFPGLSAQYSLACSVVHRSRIVFFTSRTNGSPSRMTIQRSFHLPKGTAIPSTTLHSRARRSMRMLRRAQISKSPSLTLGRSSGQQG